MSKDLVIEKQVFRPGDSGVLKLNVGRLPSDTSISLRAHIFRSKKPGPTVLLLAGVHGDEINGIEIVRQVLKKNYFQKIKKGSAIVIPLLNIYGFITFNRYVPDGKDVNRSFPGNKNGSLASRIARTLTKNIFPHIDYIFDYHTGGDLRYNHPQIRYTKSDSVAGELAEIFNPPFIIQSGIIPKSLRKTARGLKIPTIVYEGGESARINHTVIDRGLQGTLRCLNHLGILETEIEEAQESIILEKTTWIRASYSGVFIWRKRSGDLVSKGEKLGTINDPYGQKTVNVISKYSGYIIGHNNASVVNHGDALFHIAPI